MEAWPLIKSKVFPGLRRLVYLVSPNETSFETVEDVPKYVDEAIPFFVALMLLEIPILLVKGKKLPRFNDGFSSIANGLLSLLHNLLFRSVELATYIWVFERFNIVQLPWDSPWTWLAGFLGVDLGYYWVHRCGHEVNIFWAGHQTHHSSEDYNLTTALRQSALLKYISWIFYLPLALFVPPSVFLVHSQFNLLYQFWIHTETVDKLGPLEWILNTPSHHRVHHGRNRYCIDKNYGGTLIIFDRIFGTFEAEKEEVVYGLVHPINTWNPLYSQFCHLMYMWEVFKTTEGFGNKLSVILKGPGWGPGKPRTGLIEDIPDVHAPQERYNSDLPLWANLYVWLHMGLLLALPVYFIVAGIVFIVFTLTCFGFLYDHKKSGPALELIRCVILTVSLRTVSAPDSLGPLHLAVTCIYAGSVLIWTFICLGQVSVTVKAKKIQ
ncbi:hypothetical protein FSP39_016156 [Pinctada imbricata]|uniref:Alkylglycerol monooxygenase n=1 Tax=Pinctada imbricata TaxID=66713 RepID=A0AA88YIL7_PINIB|nr:hypothetical protein FSP39_016156 [Pinctada imbricata]